MTESEVFELADRRLSEVVAQIADDQWAMEMPATFARRQTERPPTLREIINYHAYDDAWVPDMVAGRTMDEVGREMFKGDLLGDHPKESFATIVDRAVAAVRGLDDLERMVHCSFGDYTARIYLVQISGFRGLRSHDLAKVIGVDPTIPDRLAQGLWDELSPVVEEWRAIGVFPPRVPVPDDAPLQDRLLGLTGRDPHAS